MFNKFNRNAKIDLGRNFNLKVKTGEVSRRRFDELNRHYTETVEAFADMVKDKLITLSENEDFCLQDLKDMSIFFLALRDFRTLKNSCPNLFNSERSLRNLDKIKEKLSDWDTWQK
jgi:hypothetical protein